MVLTRTSLILTGYNVSAESRSSNVQDYGLRMETEPSSFTDIKQILKMVAVPVSFSSSAFLPEEDLPHNQEGSRGEELPLEGRQRCPGRRNRHLPTSMTVDTSLIDSSSMDGSEQMEDGHTRSLSPWEYSLSTDTIRFPVVIAEADCLTFACVDTDGHESPDLICSFSYRLEGEVVTLGCTCVRPTISYY